MGDLPTLIDLVKQGDVHGVQALVTSDPTLAGQRLPSGETPVMAAVYRGHVMVVNALIDLGAPLDVFAAAATGRIAALREALQDPKDVNAFAYDGWTPLHLAAFFGHLDIAVSLLDAGADPRAVSANAMANTPLHAAAAGQHAAVAVLLVKRGGDGHLVDGGGYSARAIAEQNGLSDVVAAIDAAAG